jgi:hypothetical protein
MKRNLSVLLQMMLAERTFMNSVYEGFYELGLTYFSGYNLLTVLINFCYEFRSEILSRNRLINELLLQYWTHLYS